MKVGYTLHGRVSMMDFNHILYWHDLDHVTHILQTNVRSLAPSMFHMYSGFVWPSDVGDDV